MLIRDFTIFVSSLFFFKPAISLVHATLQNLGENNFYEMSGKVCHEKGRSRDGVMNYFLS